LSEPADPITNLPGPLGDFDIEATNYLLNEGYVARMKGLLPKPKKQRHHQYKVNDFVDTTKAVEGSSASDDEELWKKARSKAAREELASEVPQCEKKSIKSS